LHSLRDTPYSLAAESKDLKEVLQNLFQVYINRVRRISKFVPEDVKNLSLAFIREEIIKDVMSLLASAILGGKLEPKELLTYNVEESPLKVVEQDPDSLRNPQRLAELLMSKKWLRPYVSKALDLATKSNDIVIFNPLSASFVIDLYSKSVMEAELNRKELNDITKMLCLRLRTSAIAAVLEASKLNIPPKVLYDVSPRVDICNIWNKLANIYEREQEFEALINNLKREFPSETFEGEDFNTIIGNMKLSALRRLRDIALGLYAGYPLSASLVVAALSLARLEYDSLKIVISGISLGLSAEEYVGGIISV
jgi:vacuolar-type H+-ATPase subunit C/Vma6